MEYKYIKKQKTLSHAQVLMRTAQKFLFSKRRRKTTDKRRANCSKTTGERLALSVASHNLVRLASAYLKGRDVSAQGGGATGGSLAARVTYGLNGVTKITTLVSPLIEFDH